MEIKFHIHIPLRYATQLLSVCSQSCATHHHNQFKNFSFFLFYLLGCVSCSMQTLLVAAYEFLSCGMWNMVPQPGIEPKAPELRNP